jgi:hypothetical protein
MRIATNWAEFPYCGAFDRCPIAANPSTLFVRIAIE